MAVTILQKAHGKGRDALLRTETPPVAALPPLNADDTDRGLAIAEQRGRPFEPGNQAAKGRKPAMARLGVVLPDGASPEYRRALRSAKRYVDRRRRELAVQHGGVLGSGPSAMLASAGLALAASRYVYAQAAVSGDAGLFRQAAGLADSARQQELTAVALAAREAESLVEDDDTRVRRERLETARSAAGTPLPGSGV